MRTEPRTPQTFAGRGLLEWAAGDPTFGALLVNLGNSIADAEVEAAEAALDTLAAKVAAMQGNYQRDEFVRRKAVLAIIEEAH